MATNLLAKTTEDPNLKHIAIVLSILALAAPALAGPPQSGVYTSSDLGGSVLTGRFSESWPGGAALEVGNTINAMSWDGGTLGTQWFVRCASVAVPPMQISDTRDGNGTGEVTWQAEYGGGNFWLGNSGPWGDEDYTGVINTFSVTTTYQYVMGQILGIRSNLTMTGVFDGYGSCMEYMITNTAVVGDTDSGPLPGDYPPFLTSSCVAGGSQGAWGSVTDIAMQIYGSCVVPVEEASWGAIKARYSE